MSIDKQNLEDINVIRNNWQVFIPFINIILLSDFTASGPKPLQEE